MFRVHVLKVAHTSGCCSKAWPRGWDIGGDQASQDGGYLFGRQDIATMVRVGVSEKVSQIVNSAFEAPAGTSRAIPNTA